MNQFAMFSYIELISNVSEFVPFLKTSELNNPEEDSGFISDGFVKEFSALSKPGYP